jgi:hypothetical protein
LQNPVNSKDAVEGSISVTIDQNGNKLKPEIRTNDNDPQVYDISFTPEIDANCRIEIEYCDTAENFIYGDTFDVSVKQGDFLIIPFPLEPAQINQQSTFKSKKPYFKLNFIESEYICTY